MPTYSGLVKMSYQEFTNKERDSGANTNIMTSAAMARLEKVIEKFNKNSSLLSKVNICIAILLGIVALFQLIIMLK